MNTQHIQNSPKRRTFAYQSKLAALALVAYGFFAHGAVPRLNAQILQYDFNEGTGTLAANSGSAGTAGDLTLGGAAGWGPGVEGAAYSADPSDEANTYAMTAAPVTGLDNLSAFTITGWLNSNAWLDELVVMNWANGGAGATLRLQTSGELALILQPFWDNNVFVSSTGGEYAEVEGWVFFAVSWDGSGATTDKVNFYLGGEDLTASLVTTADRGGATTTSVSPEAFMVGQSSTALENWWSAYQGSIDDVRIYGSVLDLTTIQGVQAEAIPEPHCVALVGLALGALSCGRRRLRRLLA